MLHPNYTIRATLRKDTKNAKGQCQIAVVITSSGKRKYESTGLRVSEDQWSERTGKVKNHPNATLLNDTVTQLLIKAEASFLGGTSSHVDNNKHFLSYCKKIALSAKVAANTRRQWTIQMQLLERYETSLTFNDITAQWLHRYLRHRNESTVMNTAVKSLQFIRRMFNEALKDGTTSLYPFEKFKLPSEKYTIKTYLTLEELDRLEGLFIKDLPREMRIALAYFLLECYSGLRFSDWTRWSVEKIDKIDCLKVTTAKTNTPVYVPIQEGTRLQKIIQKIADEQLAFKETSQEVNRKLKTLALLADIKKTVTTHVGRHTAATLLLERGFSREAVAEVLGISTKIVDTYAKMTRQKIRGEFERYGGL